ncbi:MAG: peptidase S10, partial [Bryobacteraceae bacterium]
MAGLSMIAILCAQEHPAPPPGGAPHEATAAQPPAPPPVDTSSVTKHSIQINGKSLAYTATAGTLVIQKEAKPWASIFYVAYALDGVQDVSKRPITFAFNGGPGSSSVWLHLGALGPKRIAMGPDGEQPKPPYRLVDNEDTALQFTDLVFIDPVSTGFSRA